MLGATCQMMHAEGEGAAHLLHAAEVRSEWLKGAMEEAEATDKASGVWDMKAAPREAQESDFHHLLGAHVKVLALKSRPELNGAVGRCMSWDAQTERAGVKLVQHAKMLSIKPANLKVLTDEEAVEALKVEVACSDDAVAALKAELAASDAAVAAAEKAALAALTAGVAEVTIDETTEFEGNSTLDRYALYLRPLDSAGAPLHVDGATDAQERWGGLHATLCSFAPPHDSSGKPTHRGDVFKALESVHAAAIAAAQTTAPPGVSCWQLRNEGATLPAKSHGKGLLLLPTGIEGRKGRGTMSTLTAMSAAVGDAGMCNPRPADTLHVSCGSVDGAEAAREPLLACGRWEVCVVKCAAGEAPLRVTEVVERRELCWADAGSGAAAGEVAAPESIE